MLHNIRKKNNFVYQKYVPFFHISISVNFYLVKWKDKKEKMTFADMFEFFCTVLHKSMC